MAEVPAKVKQRHRSEAEWRELVAAWRASGQTRDAWCREQGVGFESLRRWIKRIGGTNSDAPVVELTRALRAPSAIGTVRLRITPRGEVELLGEFSEELLRGVLCVIRESTCVS